MSYLNVEELIQSLHSVYVVSRRKAFEIPSIVTCPTVLQNRYSVLFLIIWSEVLLHSYTVPVSYYLRCRVSAMLTGLAAVVRFQSLRLTSSWLIPTPPDNSTVANTSNG